jgi:hypothetical protein
MDPHDLRGRSRGKVLAAHKAEGAAAFAAKDPTFRAACEQAGIPPTKRQARRWRQGRGLAYTTSARGGPKASD